MAVALLAACTQDELAEQGNTLPDGEYPLQIGSVTITAESSEEPWTCVAENETDGMGSHWTGGEEFYVKFEGSDEVGIYKITDAATGAVVPVKSIYWKNTQPANIIAWYAKPQPDDTNNGRIFLNNQEDDGLVYVLRAEQTATYGEIPVTLKFKHQLAKVRVVAKGTAEVRDIFIQHVPMTCFIEEGKITGQDNSITGGIQMLPVEREGIGTCWEASVGPGVEIKSFNIENTETVSQIYDLTSPVTTQAGALHTITWTVNNAGTTTIDFSGGDYEINGDGTYYFSGTASHAIKVTGGNPEIYLEDAQINVSDGNAIDITGGNPTIHIKGNDNEVSSSDGAGIYVAGSSTVTITGRSRDDALTTRGGNGGSGIGGNHATCGNIEISNMTVHAHGSDEKGDFLSAGIGGSGNNGCGTITIDNATISAYGASDGAAGNMSSPGIGGGLRGNTKGTYSTITIKNNSQVSVQRGSNRSDYIGSGGSTTNPANSPNGIDATVDETSTITPLN